MKFSKSPNLLTVLFLLCPLSSYADSYTVKMLNESNHEEMVFHPAILKVKLGDTINFVPTDLGHTPESRLVPPGAKTWQGFLYNPLSVKLEQEGLYVYECNLHPRMAMIGIIQVGDAKNLDAARAFLKIYKKELEKNAPRLDAYIKDAGLESPTNHP